jgi:hypothetical protein
MKDRDFFLAHKCQDSLHRCAIFRKGMGWVLRVPDLINRCVITISELKPFMADCDFTQRIFLRARASAKADDAQPRSLQQSYCQPVLYGVRWLGNQDGFCRHWAFQADGIDFSIG